MLSSQQLLSVVELTKYFILYTASNEKLVYEGILVVSLKNVAPDVRFCAEKFIEFGNSKTVK